MDEFEEILRRASRGPLSGEDQQKLREAMETLWWLQAEIGRKNASLARLRKLLFGMPKTEKTSRVLGESASEKSSSPEEEKPEEPAGGGPSDRSPPAGRPGHGRNGARCYAGAARVRVSHERMKAGDPCPGGGCPGRLYRLGEPRVVVCVKGQVPLEATVYEREALRCGRCGRVFVAGLPEGVESGKYDSTAAGMLGLLKYGMGMPFHRIERLQEQVGVPLPAGTQWEVVREGARDLEAVYEELRRQAAQGEVLHNDDTPMRILDHLKENEGRRKEGGRTGTFTTGIVSQVGGHRIALFFTGREHAGENLRRVLEEREGQRGPPIQMCDGLGRNEPGEEFETILGNCLGHGRRNFVEVVDSFPGECRYVLETLREVYRHEAEAREKGLSPGERLAYHQAHSGPRMEGLRRWMEEQMGERKVEPNSALGEAIRYMQKRWEALTLFLREPGAPLDNNLCERALKKAILHRKNALFFKTERGAGVGDVWMSLIHTAELNGVNPFDYLVTLLKNARRVREAADAWMPWNYREALKATA